MAAKRTGPKALLFDLDGTLLDSFAAHLAAFRAALAPFGITLSRRRFLESYSPDWRETYRAVGLPRELWEEASRHWREAVRKRPPPLLPGAASTLAQLKKSYRLAIVTGGSKKRVLDDLARTKILPVFDTVVCADDVRRPKPSPHGLRLALRALRVKPRQAVYVGDTPTDFQMAANAGVAFVGIRSPFVPARARSAYRLLDSVSELVPLLKDSSD
ncbi:MAG: HAD family hydrolase [Candidatus Acidiferrales bacterium]